jgi:hypothetical protein
MQDATLREQCSPSLSWWRFVPILVKSSHTQSLSLSLSAQGRPPRYGVHRFIINNVNSGPHDTAINESDEYLPALKNQGVLRCDRRAPGRRHRPMVGAASPAHHRTATVQLYLLKMLLRI